MKLIVRSGPDSGTTVELSDGPLVVGRDEDCDLVLQDDQVSRRHARLEPLMEGGAQLVDLRSSNGTFVDGVRISEPSRLSGGEVLRFGGTLVEVAAPAPATPESPATVVTPTPVAAPAGVASAGLWLRVESGPERGRVVDLVGERFVVGRDPSCLLVLDDPTVSREHAAISPLPGGRALLTDLGSANGTFVDGRQAYAPVELDGGEYVRLGNTVLLTGVAEPAVAGPVRLLVESGAGTGTVCELSAEPFVLGRDPSCGLVLDDEEVSRQHLELARLPDGSVLATDLASSNGTFVNGRLAAMPVVLVGGERLRLGGVELRLEVPEGSAQTVVARRTVAAARRLAAPAPHPLSPEGLARAAAKRPWVAIGAWAAVFAVGVGLTVLLLPDALGSGSELAGNPESKQADRLLEERLRGPKRVTELVLVRAKQGTVDAPAVRTVIDGLAADLAALGADAVAEVKTAAATGDASLVSADRTTELVPVVLAGDFGQALEHVGALAGIVEDADRDPAVSVLLTGEASVQHDLERIAEEDLRTGEAIGLGVAFIVLLAVFGTLVASVLPIALAFVSIGVALGLAALLGQAVDLSFFVTNMAVGVGLALGIDYSLFVLTRYREERRDGAEVVEAIVASGATSSRAVLFSGMTVVLALLGLLIVPDTDLRSAGLGAILVAITSVVVTLTLLPAILRLLGDRVDSLAVPLFGRRSGAAESRFWAAVVRVVMRRPTMSLLLAVGILVAAAVPILDLETRFTGIEALPDEALSKRGSVLLDQQFSGGRASPAEIVVDGALAEAPVQAGIESLKARMAERPVFGEPVLQENEAGDLALLSVALRGDADEPEAKAAVKELRDELIPTAFAGTDARVLVTGLIARNLDYVEQTNQARPYVFVFVLGLSFVLLTVAFRSIVVPVKAVLMNLLAVGAAYGLLVLVFQKGIGASLFGFQETDAVEVWVPLFLFAILFGLSMDYHVFLLSRVREHFNRTGDSDGAVVFGITSTARVITGAALIMVAVFSGFALGRLVAFQQLGFGLGVALLIDATIIRCVIVPAGMRLLGDRNWYLPSWLAWLPRVEVEARSPER